MSERGRSDLWAYVEAPAGCAGDMFLGALVDIGLEVSLLEQLAREMGLDDVRVVAKRVTRSGLSATQVDVIVGGTPIDATNDVHQHATSSGDHPHGHTTLADVLQRLDRLSGPAAEAPFSAKAVFRALAAAEATVHGTTPEAVHFHEVGAADALLDIAGTCAGLSVSNVSHVAVGPLPWGSGEIHCAHGVMPNPAPATVHLLKGHPTVPSAATYEQVTPTGAALVNVLSSGHRPPSGFTPVDIGVGAGTHEGQGGIANVLRITLGTVAAPVHGADEVLLLETNLDDASGQVVSRAVEQLLAEGALDAWTTAVQMKKGRPGVVISALCRPPDRARIEAVLFRETPTLGVRVRPVERTTLERHMEPVQTPWGEVRVKVRHGPDGAEATPEYDDCQRLADEHDVPIRRVIDAALRVWTA